MLESLRKNSKGIFLMSISSMLACIGQSMWKLSIEKGFLFIVIGFALYGMGALLMIYAYRFGKVSVLQPVMSINYVFSLIIGFFVFDEPVSVLKVFGVFLIIFSVLMIGGADNDR